MGVAQSSINKLAGTIGAGIAAVAEAGSKIKKEKEASAEKLESAKEEASFSEAELKAAEAVQAQAALEKEAGQKAVEEAQSKYDTAMAKRPGGKGNTKAKIAETQQEALNDLTAAQKAFDVLDKKDMAARAMTARWQERRSNAYNKVSKLGGIR